MTDKLTMLEEFTIIRERLKEQGATCRKDNGDCQYKADGKSCAIGMLVPLEVGKILDELLTGPGMESFYRNAPMLSESHDNFYDAMQVIHDEADPANWEMLFDKFYAEYSEVIDNGTFDVSRYVNPVLAHLLS